jgi:hypothetical protein
VPKSFLLKDGHDVLEVLFETVQIVNNLEPKEILSLEKNFGLQSFITKIK